MASLADRLGSALRRWDCLVDGRELRGGMSVVVPVRSRVGACFMLKLLDPRAATQEATALRAFPLAASVQCFEHDPVLGALLLERLTAQSLADAPTDELIMVQAGLARQLAVPDPGGIERLSDPEWPLHLKALQRQRPHLLTQRAVGAAAEVITDLTHEQTATLTRGDLHSLNVHRDAVGHWRVLDPTPRVGTIAFESHTVIVERDKLDALIQAGVGELRRRLALFADVAEVERGWVERLCQARAVNSALYEHV